MISPTSRPGRSVTVVEDHLDGAGVVDTGVSHALALAVGAGDVGETLRLFPSRDVVAFGRQDVVTPGYRAAVQAARALGFEAVERLAGGRAAVFSTGTLAFAWAIPTIDPRAGVHSRFEDIAGLVAGALREMGLDARVGEVPGEYCPGAYSVNIAGRWKVMGVGQRLVRGAAHVGGVVAVHGTRRLREVLVPVYASLGIEWDPATVGSLEDVLGPITRAEVGQALMTSIGARADLVPGHLPPEVIEAGRGLADGHRAPG